MESRKEAFKASADPADSKDSGGNLHNSYYALVPARGSFNSVLQQHPTMEVLKIMFPFLVWVM